MMEEEEREEWEGNIEGFAVSVWECTKDESYSSFRGIISQANNIVLEDF